MGKDDKKLIRNSTAEFLVFTAQAGDAVPPVGDPGVARVCGQGVCAGPETDGERFVSGGMQK